MLSRASKFDFTHCIRVERFQCNFKHEMYIIKKVNFFDMRGISIKNYFSNKKRVEISNFNRSVQNIKHCILKSDPP